MCPASSHVAAYGEARGGRRVFIHLKNKERRVTSNVQANSPRTHTQARMEMLFIFYGQKKSLRKRCPSFFSSALSLMRAHVNIHRTISFMYAKSISFSRPTNPTARSPEFLSKYLLFDDALHIFSSFLGLAILYLSPVSVFDEKYRVLHLRFPFPRVQFKEKFPIIFALAFKRMFSHPPPSHRIFQN